MGALFNMRFEYFNTIEEYIGRFPNQNLYPFMLKGSKSIKDITFVKPYSILQGNESTGLDEKYVNIGESVFIPHSPNIDSLNLSVATSIALWEASKEVV